ncbi:MAG: hypothetical protein Q7T18_05525, partial [Sedimentisphaerales bacterium]|nr:hypothetical protein [Sedimentisphaerales bacterium]
TKNIIIVILVLLALFFTELGRELNISGSKMKATLDRELLGELFRDPVGLTHAGKYSGHFTYKSAEGIAFFFDTGRVYKTQDDAGNALDHISGKLLVKDVNERAVIDVNISHFGEECVFVLPPEPNGTFSNFLFMPGYEDMRFESGGQYRYEVSIVAGDSNLSTGKQFFLAQKRICGLEYLAVAMPILFARISWGIAGVLVIIAVIMGVVKYVRQISAIEKRC